MDSNDPLTSARIEGSGQLGKGDIPNLDLQLIPKIGNLFTPPFVYTMSNELDGN